MSKIELAQTQEELEQRTVSLQVLKAAFDREVEARVSAQTETKELRQQLVQIHENNEYSTEILRETNDRLAETLTRIRTELEHLRGANREYGRQLKAVTDNREFWYKEAQDAEAERDKWRKDWESATAELLNSKEHLATLDAAEAALKDLRERLEEAMNGRSYWFKKCLSLEAELEEPVVVEITGKEMVQALQAERQLRQEAENNLRYMVELNEWSRNELGRMNKRAELLEQECDKRRSDWEDITSKLLGAEALAQLVTPRLGELLERLAWCTETGGYPVAAEHGREYAAKIREALDDSQT